MKMTYDEMVEIAERNGCRVTGYDGIYGNIPSRIVFGNCTLVVNYSFVTQVSLYRYINGKDVLGFTTVDYNTIAIGVKIDPEEFERIIQDNIIMIKKFEDAKRICEAQKDFE